ncbi:MAG: hypothetical protein IJT16_05470 [Lachnospiraceae bacterium]|nr:hypothetical protein [Lachnospiraceae bacterium]
MSALFDDLQQGLQEAIDHEKGIGEARTTAYKIDPIKQYINTETKDIRDKEGIDIGYRGSPQKKCCTAIM